MGTPRIAIVEIGASHVACARFTANDGRLNLEHCHAEPLDAESSHREEWPQSVAAALRRLVEGRAAGDCVVIVPGHLVLTKHVRTAEGGAFNLAEHLPLALEDLVWDRQAAAAGGTLLVAARRVAIETLQAAVERVGFDVLHIVPAPLALVETVRHDRVAEPTPPLLVSVGARSATIVTAAGGGADGRRTADHGPRHALMPGLHTPEPGLGARVRTVALGGNVLSRAIAEELGIEFARAEALKLEVSRGTSELPAESALRRVVRDAGVAYGARLGAEIRRTLAYWQREGAMLPLTKIRLTGAAASLADVAVALERDLGVGIERFDASAGLATEGAIPEGVSAEMIGVAESFLVRKTGLLTLLPAAARQALAARRGEPMQLAATLSAAIALLLVFLHFRREAGDTTARLGPLQEEVRVLQVQQASNAALLRKVEELRKRNEMLRPADLARSSWAEFLGELQAGLARMEDVWLDRLQLVPASDAPETKGRKRVRLSGRVLEAGRARQVTLARANSLLGSLAASRFVAAIEGERFEPTAEGLLRFDVTLLLNPEKPL